MLLTDGINKSTLLMLMLLPLLTACVTPSPISAIVCPVLPPPPLQVQSQPSVPYSETAEQNIKAWQSLVIGTPVMSKPSVTVGPPTTK